MAKATAPHSARGLSEAPELERTVKRLTLSRLLATSWANLFSRVTLVEPTFKELVLVYRLKESKQAAEQHGVTKQGHVRVPPIAVKQYYDIPRADFNVLLPGVEPGVQQLHRLKLVGAVVGFCVTFYTKIVPILASNDSGFHLKEKFLDAVPLVVMMGTYGLKIHTQYQAAQRTYATMMTRYLYDHVYVVAKGMCSTIIASAVEQDHKEALLACALCRRRPRRRHRSTSARPQLLFPVAEPRLHRRGGG